VSKKRRHYRTHRWKREREGGRVKERERESKGDVRETEGGKEIYRVEERGR